MSHLLIITAKLKSAPVNVLFYFCVVVEERLEIQNARFIKIIFISP